jgi:predicted ArsR family transcriptional regulator
LEYFELNELASSQHDILLRLKTRGPVTARILAATLGITTVGVRQHLAALQTAGLVKQAEISTQLPGRGRPVRPWHLTGDGHRQFPDMHAEMAVTLISAVREIFGEPGLENLIDQRAKQTLMHYQDALAGTDSISQRLEILSKLRSQEGYMCELKNLGTGSWLLIENHCPICAAATACQGFCRSELEIFQAVLEDIASIERINHILEGARRCAYRVSAHRVADR